MSGKRKIHGSTKLSDANYNKLVRLAELRGETVGEATNRLLDLSVKSIPGNLRKADAPLTDLDIRSTGVEDGCPWIRMGNGRIFHSQPTKLRYARLFHLMRDRTPNSLKPETYQSAIDARRLYAQGCNYDLFPGPGATVVDAGAYVGYKAISFADAVGPSGRVIAIELDKENARLLRKNVEQNELTDRIEVHECGVWSFDGEADYTGESHMQHTLASMDGKEYAARGSVNTRTLDTIFDASGIEYVDFLNIQVNGAEVEALHGLDRWWSRVGVIRIAAYYQHEGRNISEDVLGILEQRGAEIHEVTRKGGITAIGPFRREDIR